MACFSCILISSIIWSSFFKHLFNLVTVITSSISSFSWAHLFFTCLRLLCLSDQLPRLMGKYAESMGTFAEPDSDSGKRF